MKERSNELLNICTNGKNGSVLETLMKNFGPITNHTSNKFNQSFAILARLYFFKKITSFFCLIHKSTKS